jgi:hypothetical protein
MNYKEGENLPDRFLILPSLRDMKTSRDFKKATTPRLVVYYEHFMHRTGFLRTYPFTTVIRLIKGPG